MLSPPNDHVHILDPVTNRDDHYTFDGWEPLNFVTNAKNPSNSHEYHYRGVQFRPDDHQSGVSSPPLWHNSPPGSPGSRHPNYRMLSPSSRAEAIARGQWELMEMVKNMPESCYELSLKDLVEQPARVVVETQEECLIKDYGSSQQAVVAAERVKRQESSKKSSGKMGRSGSMDNRGLFLKLVFPISLGGSKKKKNPSSSGSVGKSKTLAKVSPKPAEGSEKSSKSMDKEWWKKKRSWGSRESDSSNISGSSDGSTTSSSSNTNSTNTTHRRGGFLTSCWSGFNFRKSKSAE
nr:uncharacterized protein LOC109170288 [Ipomoea trifida]